MKDVVIYKGTTLPTGYVDACKSIAACVEIDEVADWEDKAAALAAYGFKSKNHQLERDAAEIRLRAARRVGELLPKEEEVKELSVYLRSGSKRPPDGTKREEVRKKLKAGLSVDHISRKLKTSPQLVKQIAVLPESAFIRKESRAAEVRRLLDAARKAGVSQHRAQISKTVAKVPRSRFEKLAKSDNPPTPNRLQREAVADKHSNTHMALCDGADCTVFSRARRVLEKVKPIETAQGLTLDELRIFAEDMKRIVGWWVEARPEAEKRLKSQKAAQTVSPSRPEGV